MNRPDYKKAESLAQEKLLEYKISDLVVPISEIAEAEGLSIKIVEMVDELKPVSGFLDPVSKTIYVNAADVPARQRFTIAHELGHYLLQHNPEEYPILLRFPKLNGDNPIEKEANCFAANLLVPKEQLKDMMKKFSLSRDDVVVLAQLFGVSKDVIKIRLLQM